MTVQAKLMDDVYDERPRAVPTHRVNLNNIEGVIAIVTYSDIRVALAVWLLGEVWVWVNQAEKSLTS